MLKLHPDAIRYLNLTIDQRSPIDDTDKEFLAASIIQATPRMELPGIDDIDQEGKLLDMVAGYLKSADSFHGQEILNYLAECTVKHYNHTIDELINDKISDSSVAAEDNARFELHR